MKVSTSAESVMVGAELRNTLLYHELRMKVRDISSHGKLTVELLTLPDLTPVTEFIEVIKRHENRYSLKQICKQFIILLQHLFS